MPNNDKSSIVVNMDQLPEVRILKAIDGMSERLTLIEQDLKELITLKERVGNHGETIRRFGKSIDNIKDRQREMELDLAHKESIDRLVKHVQEDVDSFKNTHKNDIQNLEGHIELNIKEFKKQTHKDIKELKDIVEGLKTVGNIGKGKAEIRTNIFKWIAGILSAVIVALVASK